MIRDRLTFGNIAFWAIASTAALVTGKSAASQVFHGATYDHLAIFSANDGKVLTKQFDQAVISQTKTKDLASWRDAALHVAERNPLEAGAVRIIALTSVAMDGKLDVARARMRLSEAISARDLPTQFWLLEDAVTRGDVAEVLRHYDRALSAHPDSKKLLFPVLTTAISDPLIRTELVPYIRLNRPWSYEFIGSAIDKAENTADVADLLIKTGGSRAVSTNRPLETMMLAKLVSQNQIDIAQRYAQWMAPSGEARESLGAFGFSAVTMSRDLRPFTWSIVEDLIVDTRLDEENGLVVAAGSGTGGVAADRVMVLGHGKWRFAQHIEMPRLSPMAFAFWTISCLADNGARQILKDDIAQQPGNQRRSAVIDIPNDCRATRFRLTVRGSEAQEDSTITIRSVSLVRM